MTGERYRLSDLARAELDALRAAGVEPTDDEIVEINALAADVMTPDARRCLARGRPFRAGDAWLYPLTIAAADWFQDAGCKMDDPGAALGYAMAHGGDELGTVDQRDVWRWFRSLHCRRGELDLAIAACIEQDEQPETPTRDTDRAPSPGELSATMMAAVGGDPAMWERQVCIGYVRGVLETLGAQQTAGTGHVAPAVARATISGSSPGRVVAGGVSVVVIVDFLCVGWILDRFRGNVCVPDGRSGDGGRGQVEESALHEH